MNLLKLFCCLLFLSGCSHSVGDPRLDGVWTSNKQITLENIGDHNLTKDQLEFLENNLGDMQYIHKNGRAAVSFNSAPIDPLQFSNYLVYESGPDYVVMGHKGKEKVKIQFYKNCIFHITDWGINEYFCKSK